MKWKNTAITKKLRIDYPIIQAGMAGGPTTPELVAAVSNAGGLGTLGAGYMTSESMRIDIEKIRKLTDRPFAVNLFVPENAEIDADKVSNSNRLLRPIREKLHLGDPPAVQQPTLETFRKQLDVVITTQVPVCSFTFGIPDQSIIDELKDRNIRVIGTATTVHEAVLNERAGMEMVVVQGSEAGGHRGTFAVPFAEGMVGVMALIPQTVDAVHIPVIAAGGIMDGRGVLAARILGAEAVQMGTAFLTCLESGISEWQKKLLLNHAETDTVVTAAFSGKPARGIRNEFVKRFDPFAHLFPVYPIQNQLTQDIRKKAGKEKNPDWLSMWAGQGVGMSKECSAAELMEQIIMEIDRFSL
ncbi:NAD(P)H-dependent flavin oxidoreductase [Sporolactobacillus vineae]|uniref:NAD(P)H-dependent flavin oxidoreductase n=1 Tax=Sporolactobacillus vineae TaxID=444463 RepID=UPI00028832D7|nr:nitronate monooxygenase [Sporolactobacillus vineae]